MIFRAVPLYRSMLVVFLLSLLLATGAFSAESGSKQDQPEKAEIEAVIKVLEDPGQREALVKSLKIMAQAQESEVPDSQLKSVAAQMLSDLADRVDDITDSVVSIADTIKEVPTVTVWVKSEMSKPEKRRIWLDVGLNLVLTLGLGYLGFYLVRLMIRRVRQATCRQDPRNLLFRFFGLLLVLVLDLLPIIAFAAAAYLTLGVVSPREKTRLVALAWVNGFILSHAALAVFCLLLAPQTSTLRLWKTTDENANYLNIWLKRLTYTSVYGYFALQAALLLGLPAGSYDALLRLLGLLLTVLLIIMILQNRESVACYLMRLGLQTKPAPAEDVTEAETAAPPKRRSRSILNRFAKVWHLFASLYVLLLFGVWALNIPGGFLFLFEATSLTILTVLIVRTVLGLLKTVFHKGFRINDDLKVRFPGLERRANQYIATLHKALVIGCYIFGLVIIMQVWGINSFSWLTSEPGKVLGGTLVSVAGILLATFILWEIANSLIENSLAPRVAEAEVEVSARTRTLLTVTRKAVAIILVVLSSLMVLAQLGINIGPLLAGAGVLGLAIGFGSQKLVQDVITGVFILLEDQMAVGDVVDLGGLAGVVEAVTIRTVRLRDVAGTVHIIPFSAISTVSNKTKDFSYYVMDIGIAYRENVDEVMQLLKDIGEDLQQDPEYGRLILEPLEVMGVDAFADSAVMIKARIKTVPIKQWAVGREFNRRMKRKFDELDIEIPFPHQTIYFGVDKKGDAPTARLAIRSGSNESSQEITELEGRG